MCELAITALVRATALYALAAILFSASVFRFASEPPSEIRASLKEVPRAAASDPKTAPTLGGTASWLAGAGDGALLRAAAFHRLRRFQLRDTGVGAAANAGRVPHGGYSSATASRAPPAAILTTEIILGPQRLDAWA